MNIETKTKFKIWASLVTEDGETRLPDRELFFDFVITAINNGDNWDSEEIDSDKIISNLPNSENIYSRYESLFEDLKDFYSFIKK